jgi:uncharacterized protein (DUF1330 family)
LFSIKENEMPAYVVVTREKTRDATELEQYKQLAPPSFKEHPAIIRATEVLEGSAVEEIVVLEFSTYEDAEAWYHSSAYQTASKTPPLGRGLPVGHDQSRIF